MAGHSKFKNIQYRKGAQDKKRAQVFSKLAKEITVAAKMGTPDPAMNARLRTAVAAARAGNMPKDNIERAIKKSLDVGGENYEEMRYEGFGVGGVGVIVESLTDYRNRTASEVRSIFSKAGGAMGETGSVAFMFDRVGAFSYGADVASADDMFEVAIEAGAEDCESSDDGHDLICSPDQLHEVAGILTEKFGEPTSIGIIWKPKTPLELEDETGVKLLKMLEALDDSDDVQNVYSNYDVSDSAIELMNSQ